MSDLLYAMADRARRDRAHTDRHRLAAAARTSRHQHVRSANPLRSLWRFGRVLLRRRVPARAAVVQCEQ
jgi:hypothetical protein